MACRFPLTRLMVIAFCLPACRSQDNICQQAADLCGASQDVDSSHCTGDTQAYAQCLVDRGDCEPSTAADCAQGSGGGGGGDNNNGGGGSDSGDTSLTITSYDNQPPYFDLSVTVTNDSASAPVQVATTFFSLEGADQNLYVPGGGICYGGDQLDTGGSENCDLQYTVPGGFEGRTIIFRDPAGHQASVDLTGVCPGGGEATPQACSDGCDNDGDQYIDCDDYDCCDLRSDCPATSACGQMQQTCAPGPEDTAPACSDGCSNDGDDYVDCDDYDCCDVRDCPATSACGQR